MDELNMDEKSLNKWQYLQDCKSTMYQFLLQRMTNNVRFTLSVGDITRAGFQLVLSKTTQT